MAKKFTMKDIRITEANRSIKQNHVERLERVIKKNGYCAGRPILVDQDGLIVDGQHRYLACKHLGIEAPIEQVDNFDLVATLNSTQLNWSLRDYVNFYAVKGIADYIILDALCKEKEISPAVAINIIYGKSLSKEGMARPVDNPIRTGDFKIPDKSEKGLAKLERKVQAILDLVTQLGLPKTDRLITAITRLSNDSNFSFKVMQGKIAYQKSRIYRCTTIQEYMVMLSNIYNNKNMKKVTV